MKWYILSIALLSLLMILLFRFEYSDKAGEPGRVVEGFRQPRPKRIPSSEPGEPKNQFDTANNSIVDSQAKIETVDGYFKKAAELAETDQNAAMSYVDSLNVDKETKNNLYAEIAFAWAKRDPHACVSWANSFEGSNTTQSILMATVASTVVNNESLTTSLNLLATIPSGQSKDMMLICTIAAIATKDLDSALKLAATASSGDAIRTIAAKISTSIIKDGDFANSNEIIDGLPYGALRTAISTSLVERVAAEDPERAFEWCLSNPDCSGPQSLGSIGSAYGDKDPLRGIALASSIQDAQSKELYLKRLAFSWTVEDPKAAGEWMVGQIDDKNYNSNRSVFDKIIAGSIDKEQSMIFDQILKIKNLEERRVVTLDAAKKLSEYNPQKAADVILAASDLSIREDSNQVSAVRILAQNWLARDPMAASQWIGSQPAGSIRDAGVTELVANILKQDKDPTAASKWAQTIQSTTQRERAMKMISSIK